MLIELGVVTAISKAILVTFTEAALVDQMSM
jgi:hypothetical protein